MLLGVLEYYDKKWPSTSLICHSVFGAGFYCLLQFLSAEHIGHFTSLLGRLSEIFNTRPPHGCTTPRKQTSGSVSFSERQAKQGQQLLYHYLYFA